MRKQWDFEKFYEIYENLNNYGDLPKCVCAKLQGTGTVNGSNREGKMKRNIRVAVGLLLLLLVAAYFIMVIYFRSHFIFGTKISQIEVGGMSAEELDEQLRQRAEEYRLTFVTWDQKEESIPGEAVGLQVTLSEEIRGLIRKQNAFAWPYVLIKGSSLQAGQVVSYDRQACKTELEKLKFMQKSTWLPSEDAYISEYTEDGYQIVPEVYGSEIRRQELDAAVEEAICSMTEVLDLAASGCYIEPKVTAEDEKLQETVDTLNRYVGTVVRYEVPQEEEILDGTLIHQWLSVENQKVKIDKQGVAAYVYGLAKKYNTAYHPRKLATSYGRTISVIGGDYGWKVDTAAEKEMILKDIRAGESIKRELVYAQRANSHEENDYGTTYVEINLTAQHLFYYKEGKLILEADLVSGNPKLGNGTLTGAYSVLYKQREAVITEGEEEKRVSCWLPFANGTGICDAVWRTRFGGSIYKDDGTEGCVELSVVNMKDLYEQIEAGCPVLIYELAQGD